ncbi:MAG TPA: response regulator transcription factor [Mycobacteriales bacterium]|nr:response regulator transcription factor [Mycobacteriales bacterium]
MALRTVLVDDDDRFRAMARRLLESEGIEIVAEVATGGATLDAVRTCQPDVVLLDIGLADVDGTDVARQLQSECPGIAVVLISTREAEYGSRVAAGIAAGYLPKDELSLAAITDVLGQATC